MLAGVMMLDIMNVKYKISEEHGLYVISVYCHDSVGVTHQVQVQNGTISPSDFSQLVMAAEDVARSVAAAEIGYKNRNT